MSRFFFLKRAVKTPSGNFTSVQHSPLLIVCESSQEKCSTVLVGSEPYRYRIWFPVTGEHRSGDRRLWSISSVLLAKRLNVCKASFAALNNISGVCFLSTPQKENNNGRYNTKITWLEWHLTLYNKMCILFFNGHYCFVFFNVLALLCSRLLVA